MTESTIESGREIVAAGPTSMQILRPVVTVQQLIESHKEAAEIIQHALQNGTDYGVIPGAGDKPVLLKPGAERLLLAFGTYADYQVLEKEIDHEEIVYWTKRKKVWSNAYQGDKSFTWQEEEGQSQGIYRYVVKASIISRGTGEIVGTGIGVCSTMETKYIDRPRDCENTVLKMAEKRALTAAVLNTFALSGRFTQDIEDLDPDQAPGASRARRNGAAQNGASPKGRPASNTPFQQAGTAINNAVSRDQARAQQANAQKANAQKAAPAATPPAASGAPITPAEAADRIRKMAAARKLDADAIEAEINICLQAPSDYHRLNLLRSIAADIKEGHTEKWEIDNPDDDSETTAPQINATPEGSKLAAQVDDEFADPFPDPFEEA